MRKPDFMPFILAALACSLFSLPVTLAVRGQPPSATIMMAERPSSADSIAANDLIKYFQAMTGVQIPLNDAGKAVRIYLGVPDSCTALTAAWPQARADLAALGSDEAFIIKAQGGHLFICALRPRGVLYGAYAFLEHFGCGFYAQGDAGEVVPPRDTLSFDSGLDLREKPSLKLRGNGPPDWAAKNRLNIVWAGGSYSDSRTWVNIVAREALTLKNAKRRDLIVLFPGFHEGLWMYNSITAPLYSQSPGLFDSRPVLDQAWKVGGYWCWSKPEMAAQAVNIAKAFLRRFPETDIFEFATSEGSGPGCQCSLCLAQGRGYHAYINFFQAVGAEIRNEFPNMRFSLTPYGPGPYSAVTADMIPTTRRPSWLIVHQPEWGITPAVTAAWQAAFRDSNYLRYSYVGHGGTLDFGPLYSKPFNPMPYVKSGAAAGYDGFTIQPVVLTYAGDDKCPWYSLHMWPHHLMRQCMWNAGRSDSTALFNAFIRGYYGAMSAPAFTFYDAFGRCQIPADQGVLSAAGQAVAQMKGLAATPYESLRAEHLFAAYVCFSARDMARNVTLELVPARTRAESLVVAQKWRNSISMKCAEARGSYNAWRQYNDSLMGSGYNAEWSLPASMVHEMSHSVYEYDTLFRNMLATEDHRFMAGETRLTAAPNPFTAFTLIRYRVEAPGIVTLQIHDAAGRIVMSHGRRHMSPGTYKTSLNGRKLPAGLYIIKFRNGERIRTEKLVLMR